MPPFLKQKLIKGKIDKVNKVNTQIVNKEILFKKLKEKDLKKINLKDNSLPVKSSNYLINRYLKNSFFKYKIYGIIIKKKIEGVFVWREDFYEKSKAIRIIDYSGNTKCLSFTNKLFLKLLIQQQAEYLDFIQYGIDDKILLKGGFRLNENKKTIVPSYFSPFVQKNNEITSAFKINKRKKIIICKGDGDQDIPH